jgi:hypothetical protein
MKSAKHLSAEEFLKVCENPAPAQYFSIAVICNHVDIIHDDKFIHFVSSAIIKGCRLFIFSGEHSSIFEDLCDDQIVVMKLNNDLAESEIILTVSTGAQSNVVEVNKLFGTYRLPEKYRDQEGMLNYIVIY